MDAITVSREQHALVQERIKEAGFSDLVRVHLLDYRELPPSFAGAFDAIVGIEMLEVGHCSFERTFLIDTSKHVGFQYRHKLFEVIDWALRPDKGCVVLSATTHPESRYSEYQYVPTSISWPIRTSFTLGPMGSLATLSGLTYLATALPR